MSKSLYIQARELMEDSRQKRLKESKPKRLNEADFEFYLGDIENDPDDFISAVSQHFERTLQKYVQALEEMENGDDRAYKEAARAAEQLQNKALAIARRMDQVTEQKRMRTKRER